MNAFITSARGLLIVSLFSTGLAAASLGQAAQPQFVGPRNTIPQTQAQATQQSRQLRASTDGASTCSTVRVKHYGHPGKGVDRIEVIDAPCGKSHLALR